MADEKLVATITHEVTERDVKTTVILPGEKPITKRWVRCDGGARGTFKKDWDEDRRLAGWSSVADAAMQTPDFL